LKESDRPVICVLGGTGSGKSTFCHLISGTDPRREKKFFVAKASESSVTKKVEMKNNLEWFDKQGGTLTLVDSPGLLDTAGEDDTILLRLTEFLQKTKIINIFVLLLSADKLGSES